MRNKTLFFTLASLAVWASCEDDERFVDPGPAYLDDRTGESCVGPDECYADLVASELAGEVQCLDRVDGGYCTHLCEDDDDCCAVEGECEPGDVHVCGPFEDTNMRMCFISCEERDIDGDAGAHCRSFHPDFICRSTGGGAANRRVCVPSGHGPCEGRDDCPDDFGFCCENALGSLRCYDAAGADGRECL